MENKQADSLIFLKEENELYFSEEEILRTLNEINISTDNKSIYNLLKIVNSEIYKPKNSFPECFLALDLICILELKDVARSVYEEENPNLDFNIYDYYLDLIRLLEIDFKFFIILAGEDFFKSDEYDYDGENIGEEQVLKYLIYENYEKVARRLRLHYNDTYILLCEIIKDKDFYERFLEVVDSLETLEDCFDNTEIMKLYQWADGGFHFSGE